MNNSFCIIGGCHAVAGIYLSVVGMEAEILYAYDDYRIAVHVSSDDERLDGRWIINQADVLPIYNTNRQNAYALKKEWL